MQLAASEQVKAGLEEQIAELKRDQLQSLDLLSQLTRSKAKLSAVDVVPKKAAKTTVGADATVADRWEQAGQCDAVHSASA